MGALILVVDDDADWRNLLSRELCQAGFEVTQAATGAEALARIQAVRLDLLILDVHLPGRNGYEVCEAVRRGKDYPPIIMISGIKMELEDREAGLRVGANCYFKKPVSAREVVAQVRSLLGMASALKNAESQEKGSDAWLEIGDYLRIHLKRRLVMTGGRKIKLTSQEFRLLAHLSQHIGQVVSANELLQKVWQDRSSIGRVEDSRLKSAIRRLRSKIEPDPEHPRYLMTVRGEGYYLCLHPKSD